MLFGATVAQVGFRGRLGRRAIAAGAAIALIPDLDVAAGWIGGEFATWLYHRGITHSIFFGPILGPLLGWLLWRWDRRRFPTEGEAQGTARRRAWIYLAILALLTHPLIDVFTSYGTQLLAPFSRMRFAINAMPIIDPIYSLALAAALVVGIGMRRRPRLAQDAAAAALLFISAYTLMGWAINAELEAAARREFPEATRVTAYPTLFQPWYRRIVAETPESVLVGYRSVLVDRPVDWLSFAKTDDPRIETVARTPEARLFDWFSMNNLYWQVADQPDGGAVVEAMDTRYGMPGGDLGFWGIRARLDAAGQPAGPIETFTRRPPANASSVRDLWAGIVGG
jgi:inner membrane protein